MPPSDDWLVDRPIEPSEPAAVESPQAAAVPDGRGGLLSPSFLALLATQFLVALNDNMFRWLIVPIGDDVLGGDTGRVLGLAGITLPFVLFSAPAGFLADRFSKRNVMIACKVAEVVTMLMGIAAILVGNTHLMFAVLFLMGAQAACFSPSKLGSIPEIVRSDRISAANGVIGMTTMAAIIMGVWAGGLLFDATSDRAARIYGTQNWWISAAALLGVAGVGLACSLFIGRLRVADPSRRLAIGGETVRNVMKLVSYRGLFLVALGSAFFWGLGALAQINIDKFATASDILDVTLRQNVGILLAVLVMGIGLGSVLAGLASAGKIELGLVPFGAAGIVLSSLMFWTVPGAEPGTSNTAGFAWTCVWLAVLGVSAGLYDVPLQAYLQHNSPEKIRGTIISAYNFLAYSAMLLASPIFWVLAQPLGLSARGIFIVAGLSTLPMLIAIVRLVPRQTLRLIFRTLFHLFYRVRIEGLENLPKHGPVMLTPNHVTYLDGLLVTVLLPRQARFIVYADYFAGWHARWFARLADVIPIHPGKRSIVESLRTARETLQAGEVVGVFPEGTLTSDGDTQPFQQGFLRVLRGTGAPVVPVYLEGLWGSIFSRSGGRAIWKVPRGFRRRILIRLGPPLADPKDPEEVRQAVLRLGRQS